jgi:cytochrome c-type biogenesis protein
MDTKAKTIQADKASLWLWGTAILAVVILIGILGWQGFYGYIIPQASKAATLPLAGVVGFAFIAGILSFFAPCPFAVFPAYAAFFLASKEGKGSPKSQALRFSGTASAGIIGFYIVLGAILASLGTQLAFYTNYLKLGVIALIFVFGFVLLTGRQLPTSFLDKWTNKLSVRFSSRGRPTSGWKNWGPFGYGIIYAIAGAACFLPVILTIALIPIISGKFVVGFSAFITYGLAISVMLTIATFILASGKQKLLQTLAGKADAIKKLSGAILIATALFLVAFYIKTGM